ncbi:myosin-crossreactive antigen [Bradyrhizobium sp. USDA 313]
MYYGSGNYEAFARPRKPEGADNKTAWLVGAGLAALSGAAFLIRDGHMRGDRITILERLKIPGGALDGNQDLGGGFVIRGGREMEDHFECLWDLFRSIPSLEIEGASVLDEFYWLNKDDPNYSLQRATVNQGQDARTDGLFTLSEEAQKELIAVFLASREEMESKRIDEVFGKEFFFSNFWLYWRTMFAFEEWHSALEMKLYLHRFIHHIGGLPDFSALKFTRYNQYESLVLPLCKWLLEQGVKFRYDVEVTDVDFDLKAGCKQATAIHWLEDGVAGGIGLGADDLVFITIGSLTENSDKGDHHTPSRLDEGPAPAWICGGVLRPRTRLSAARTSSAAISLQQNGNRQRSRLLTRAFRPISARSPNAIRSAARSSREGSSRRRIRTGCSVGL